MKTITKLGLVAGGLLALFGAHKLKSNKQQEETEQIINNNTPPLPPPIMDENEAKKYPYSEIIATKDMGHGINRGATWYYIKKWKNSIKFEGRLAYEMTPYMEHVLYSPQTNPDNINERFYVKGKKHGEIKETPFGSFVWVDPMAPGPLENNFGLIQHNM